MARTGSSSLADLGRLISWHRRKLAVIAAMAAVAFGISAVTPDPPRTATVVVAAHRLAGGHQLQSSDLTTRQLAPSTVPDGAATDIDALIGRTVVAPLTEGSVLTSASVLDVRDRPQAADGMVIAPLRISDAAVVRLLRVGDRVDVVAVGQSISQTGPALEGSAGPRASKDSGARVIAEQVRVVTIPRTSTDSGLGSAQPDPQTLLLVEVDRDQATALAAAAASSQLSLLL